MTEAGPADELRVAHERIAELEGILAGTAPPRRRRRSVARLGVLVLGTMALGFFGASAVAPGRQETLVDAPGRVAPLPAGALELADGAGPSFADVDGDGKKDLVVRAWRRGHDGAPLYVAVVDRKTYAMRWAAGPFLAQTEDRGQLVVTATRVVVEDAEANLHVLESRSGRVSSTIHLWNAKSTLRGLEGDPDRIIAKGPGSRDVSVVVDLANGRLGSIVPDDARACALDGSEPCLVAHPPPAPDAIAKVLPGVLFTTDVIAGSDHVTIADVSVSPRLGVVEHAVAWDPASSKVTWHAPLVPETRVWGPSPSAPPKGLTALATGRIHHLYPTANGTYRLVVRSLATGGILVDAALPELDYYGARITSFTAEGEDVFIVANDSLFVIKASTGTLVRRIDSL